MVAAELPLGPMSIPDHYRDFQAAIRRFIDDEVIPYERAGTLSAEALARVHKRVRELGLWGASVPAKFGGAGLSALEHVLATEEICRTTLWWPIYGAGNAIGLLNAGTSDQIERYLLPTVRGERLGCLALTEPTGGSDLASMCTTAVRRGDQWVLNGRKTFITYGDEADYALVFAVTDRRLRQRGGITVFLVDRNTEGYRVVRTIPTMGAAAPAELDFSDCVLDDSQRIGAIGAGFELAQRTLGTVRCWIGAYALGVATRCLELASDYANKREVFGRVLAEQGQAQAMIADSAIDIEVCRWLTYRAAAEADRGADTRLLDSMVKVYASEMVSRVTDRALQIHGGWGYSRDLPIERFYRDSRMFRITEGPNEVHRWLIARELLKVPQSVEPRADRRTGLEAGDPA